MSYTIPKNVLSLGHKDAMDFFMSDRQYNSTQLPEYFDFNKVLDFVRERVGDLPYEDCLCEAERGPKPEALSDVSFNLRLNKDGRYVMRPVSLINPYLYYFLVRELCDADAWQAVQQLFQDFAVPRIKTLALPLVVREGEEPFYKSATILAWWHQMEQRTIECALEYRYMFMTDISNCYPSVPTKVFEAAFALAGTSKTCGDAHSALSGRIVQYLSALQQGQHVGLPQGSVLFDFLAEIVLGYADLLLHEKIEAKRQQWAQAGHTFPEYEILRYRDDYRIFCNDKQALDDIIYALRDVLESLNMRMNSGKTKVSTDIVVDAIKPDKLDYIYNTPVFNKRGMAFDSYQKYLLYVLMFARKHPNSGQIKVMLSDIDRRIDALKKKGSATKTIGVIDVDGFKEVDKDDPIFIPAGTLRAMAAICTQIAQENVTCTHYALRVLSKIVMTDPEQCWAIIDDVARKLNNNTNAGYNQLWLQNMTYQWDRGAKRNPYDTMPLCRVVAQEEGVTVWNNSWLRRELTADFPLDDIVNRECLEEVTDKCEIVFRETHAYDEACIEVNRLDPSDCEDAELIATL